MITPLRRATSVGAATTFLALTLAFLVGLVAYTPARAACTIDVQGADDQPGQKDVSQFCNDGSCGGTSFSLGAAFDDRSWSGANTGDGCFHFDTNGNGNSDRAICGTLTGAGLLQAGSPTCYTCGDTRPDRCTSSVLVACATTCTATATADPFAGDPTHVGGSKCNGTNCLTLDATITCCVAVADAGGPAGVLIDACSYPSQQPNSDPSDCVVSRQCSKTDPNDPVCDDVNPCTVDTCNTVVGVCTHVAGNAGAQCRGGDGVCDSPEVCTGSSIDCPADTYASGGICRPVTDLCDVPESCDGSSASCPADEVASGGVCRSAVGQCDVAESCNGVSKACPADAFQANATACTDDNACTTGDVCSDGVCIPGSPFGCDDGNACTDDGCDPSTGCTHVDNSDPCSDGSECTVGDACSGGACVGGPAPDCDDNEVCTDDGCDPSTPGGCVHTNNTDPCSDGSDCTTNDACSGGSCAGGPPPNCDDANACTTDSCPGATGCEHAPVGGNCCNVDADCADVDECTINERCVANQCVSDDRTCDDGEVCTDDACNPSTPGGCVYVPNNDPCSDGSECTTNDACSGGICVGGPAPDCEDNEVCTDDGCNPSTPGGCVHTNNTDPCSDGSECTTNDTCGGGVCVPGPAPDCDDGEVCTDDTCNPSTPGGCEHAANANGCEDGNGCTVDDVCVGGRCQAGGQKSCDDANLCTDDGCSAPSGACVNAPNDDPCSDGNVCTDGDVCFAGTCQPGGPLDCNDHLACTVDVCTAPATGCEHPPVAEPCCDLDSDCADTDFCTVNERCVNHACTSDPRDCSDGNPCTLDGCENAGGGFLCVNTDCNEVQGKPCPLDVPTCLLLACGNTIVEAGNGETCDPPGSTMLPNGQPCRADCTYCGDAVKNGSETCDDGNSVTGCSITQPQKPADDCQNTCTFAICKDPAKITLAEWIDRYDVHGRLPSTTLVDFASNELVVELRNPRGKVLYRASLDAGALIGDPSVGRFKYGNKSARAWGGLGKVKISRHKDGYRLTATTYGNLFQADDDMITNVYSGTDRWTVHGVWKATRKGWKFVE